MATLLARLGGGAFRHRVLVVVAWLLVLVAVGVGAKTLSGSTVNTFSIPGQESTTALDLLDDRFGAGANGASAQVVLQAPAGAKITDAATTAAVRTVVTRLNALPGVAGATNPLDPKAPVVSADGRATYSTVTYEAQAPDITDTQRQALLDVLTQARSTGLVAEATGQATEPTGAGVGGAGEIVGVVVALLVLALTYGSLIAAGMNLLTALVGVAVGALGITTLTGFVELQSTTPLLALMLGLAVGIDYALFIFTRFRQELLAGRDVGDAVGRAVGTAGSAVVTAGLTVVIALAGLSVAGIPFLTEMGLAAAATIVVAVLVGLTLVPAVLGLLGRRVLSRRGRTLLAGRAGAPVGGAHEATRDSRFTRWGHLVTRRRWASLAVSVVALAVIAIPVFSMRTTLGSTPSEGSTQAKATQLLDQHFGPGFSGPLLVLVDGAGATQRAAAVAQEARTVHGVAAVAPPQPNRTGTAALVTVVPTSGPTSAATEQVVRDLRSVFKGQAGPRVYVTGTTAVSVDVSSKLDSALPRYLVLVVGLALVLLVLVFRSILVPVTGVVGFLLTIGSSLGATTAVFQWGWLKSLLGVTAVGPLLSLAPIIVIGILFGLAMDYQVFLVSRMHEAHAHGAAPRDAIVAGYRNAAPVVVAAAAIMFAVFAGFFPGGDATIKPIAFSLALGIAFDALVVRMVAMPAALALMGGAAWYLPRWLRWLPTLDVEGAALERSDVRASARSGDVAERAGARNAG